MNVKISLELIKELRLKTGSGFLKCKQALLQSHGNLLKAIDYLRYQGVCNSIVKNKKKTLEGSIFLYNLNKKSILLELNSETDFVSKNIFFINFGKKIVKYILKENIKDILEVREIFKNERIDLINRFGENILINRFKVLSGTFITSYIHLNKIGVLVLWEHSKIDFQYDSFKINDFMKKIAMHIAALNPLYLSDFDIPKSVLNREKNVQKEIIKKLGKPKYLEEKILNGRMRKFFNENTLLGQNFILDLKKSVQECLEKENVKIIKFIRMEVGVGKY